MLCSRVQSLAVKWVMIHFFCCASLSTLDILQAVDEFVCELRLRELNPKKQRKIAVLALDEEEWTWVCLFSNILQVSPSRSLYPIKLT